MSVRRDTANRKPLVRICGTCGKEFGTSADSPWIRQIPRDGKKMATTYYCSTGCFQKSYKHIGWYDGKADQRRKEKDRNRTDNKERWKKYSEAHRKELNEKRMKRYWANREEELLNNVFYRKKRKMLTQELA